MYSPKTRSQEMNFPLKCSFFGGDMLICRGGISHLWSSPQKLEGSTSESSELKQRKIYTVTEVQYESMAIFKGRRARISGSVVKWSFSSTDPETTTKVEPGLPDTMLRGLHITQNGIIWAIRLSLESWSWMQKSHEKQPFNTNWKN